jgi:DNA primase
MEREFADLGRDAALVLVEERLQVLRERARKKRLEELQLELQKADQENNAEMRRRLLQEYQDLCAAGKRG